MLITDFYRLYKKRGLDSQVIKSFQSIIYNYFKQFGRKFPFREEITPYNVLVSEIMLQQTQTSRVTEKFLEFIKKFPDFKTLSEAPLEDILKIWKGLGYNRRAIALKNISEKIIKEYDGNLPDSFEVLKKFSHIGEATASSILTFAFNIPSIFIETNIRRVFLYFFFPKRTNINDNEIIPLIKATLDKENPRNWYYALMDYGVMLKKKFPQLNKKSAHYKKQAPFKGSNRELRGKILQLLLEHNLIHKDEIFKKLSLDPKRVNEIMIQLEKEGFIKINDDIIGVI